MSRIDAAIITWYAATDGTPTPSSVRDSPNATMYASKLMQIRRKVSTPIRWISTWPSGKPISTPGTIHGRIAVLSEVNRPR